MTASAPKKKGFLTLAAVLLSVGGGVGYWMYTSHAKENGVVNANAEKPLTMVHLEPFIVNLADANEKDYLRVGMDLGVAAAESESKSEKSADVVPMMRDAIIGVLSTRHSDELLTPDGKQKLKDDLVKTLNARPAGSNVREIYFNEFLVQH